MAEDNKPTCAQRMSSIGRFIYNGEKHTVLGRTPKSWALIIIFYIIYYALLAGFFVGMLSVLLYGIIEESKPMRTGDQSLIRMNPGLGIRPIPDPLRTLVLVDQTNKKDLQKMIDNLDAFYKSYSTINASLESDKMQYASCNLSDAQANRDFDPMQKICRLNPAVDWGNCTQATGFGYEANRPCVVVKMNRIYGWLPSIEDPTWFNHTLVRCEPENDGDVATFGKSQPEYYPGVRLNNTNYGYFSSALFPYLNQPGYTTPAVAVRFPSARRNVMIMLQCRLYNLLNSEYSKADRDAMVRFELLILDKGAPAGP